MDIVMYAKRISDEVTMILRTESDGVAWWFPEAPGNRHYEEYLAWIAEGNEPEVINDQS